MIKAILTGHTRGLGAALAQELQARGIPLLALARRHATGTSEQPKRIRQIELDLSDSAALDAWLKGDELRTFATPGDTLLLINNAGTLGPVGPLDTQDGAAIAHSVSLNITAPLMLSSGLARQHKGALKIVHISSGAARNAYPGWSIYGATKAALDHHARAVQLDGRPNLKICSLAPGVIDTDMQAEIRATPVECFPLQARFVQLKQEDQLSSPGQVAKQLLNYLLSEQFCNEAVADLRQLDIADIEPRPAG